ncbi:hypothetical protein F4861DRAFT_274244 [Xylaria intraflava]|nr:hypothetical protein F4861DRAFT_274244 [Xylaria intraflava]
MPKWDKTRNYYADLELSSSASSDEIKKQFKKLALKYHPDRNPGREAEVNPKFQVIQSAHEILSDATQKRQYDEARQTYASRYPSSAGVKGNPWQNVSKAYPTPPRRQPSSQTRPTSGGQRYESFTASMPRNPRPRAYGDDTQFRRNNADAWDSMRPSSTRRTSQAPPPPPPPPPGRAAPGRAPTARDTRPEPVPVPPRTAYQKHKAEAAFGTTKKAGFTPRSQGVADEPPVTNKNYFTNRTHSYLFTEPDPTPETPAYEATAAPPTNPPAQSDDQPTDNRQRTPYHTPGGEKTSLFDSSPGLGRTTSTRMPNRPAMRGFPRARPRSSSPARSSSNDGGSEDSVGAGAGINRASSRENTTAQPKAGESSKPKTQPAADIPPRPANGIHGSFMPSASTAQRNANGPSVYAPQISPAQFPSQPSTTSRPKMSSEHTIPRQDWSSRVTGYRLHCPSSEEKTTCNFSALLPMEIHQRMTVDHLVSRHATAPKSGGGNGNVARDKAQRTSHNSTTNSRNFDANGNRDSSFNFTTLGSDASSNSSDYKTFTRNSTENINTRFVDDEFLDDWQFKAGSASANELNTPSRPRPQSRNRPLRRQTPLPKRTFSTKAAGQPEAAGEANAANSKFEWNERIGPEHFEPQPANNGATSPTRRANSKKSKSVKMTAGTAAVVDEDSEESQEASRPSGANPLGTDAMDIDTPTPTKTEEIPQPANANNANRARKYSAEPHREEWRAGDVNGVGPKASGPTTSNNNSKANVPETNAGQSGADTTKQFPPRHGGSEDTEEFVASFSDWKKVEPFTGPSPSGLKSFDDLKSTLPFESRPSEHIPPDIRPTAGLLAVPTPPVAPRLPPTMAVAGLRPNASSFRKYAQDFNNYMFKWEAFNNEVVTHLAARRDKFRLRCLQRGANWLENGASDYLVELDQDLDVQKKYNDAFIEHRKRVAEYLEFRDRVK